MSFRLGMRRFVVASTLVIVAACARTPPYATLDDAAEPLRARFNADAGHVRVMMLVAPT